MTTININVNTYEYRDLPCNIEDDDHLWCVIGYDVLSDIGGVLEWCTSEQDAQEMLEKMNKFKHLHNLRIAPWRPRWNESEAA